MAGTRNVIKDFFKNQLGFSDEFIIEIDQEEIDYPGLLGEDFDDA